MNKNIDLCKILIGCEGIVFWHLLWGEVTLDSIILDNEEYPIILRKKDNSITYLTCKGTWHPDYDGECLLFPSKDQRDWSKFEKPIPINTPMMVSNSGNVIDFRIRFYREKFGNSHVCITEGIDNGITYWKYMIPFNKFNPNDIEASLKYNIQK